MAPPRGIEEQAVAERATRLSRPLPIHFGLQGLSAFTAAVRARMDAVVRRRQRDHLNGEGGDLGGGLSDRLIVRHAAHHLAAAALARAHCASVDDLLDVGCGTGAPAGALAELLGSRLHLHDREPRVLEVARATQGPASASTTLADLPQAGMVTLMDVLEHVDYARQPAFLSAVMERVRPGGLLVIATPDERTYLGGSAGYAPHVGVLDPERIHQLLERVSGRTPQVWSLVGGPFDPSPLRQVVERVGNAMLRAATGLAPTTTGRIAARCAHQGDVGPARTVTAEAAEPVWAVPGGTLPSTGMLAAVQV